MYEKARIFVTVPFMAEQRQGYSLIENENKDYSMYFNVAESSFRSYGNTILPVTMPTSAKTITSILPKGSIKLLSL